ncbi:MAG: nucleotide exchange factor GrpE [Planctomycetota bacterium]|nr:nucleotide exchange factor GrpE [Planctomycetota bacterium]MDA1178605.1 nucleotide exchange factor GrpE [Planctomycetota bacterium]
MPHDDPTPWENIPDDEKPNATKSTLDPSASDGPTTPSSDAVIAQLESQLQEAQQRVLRAQAELENSRRRMRREMEEERRYASQSLIGDLLPVLDNVCRAVESAEKTDPDSSLLQGVRMVSRLLEDVLARHHCPRIVALGKEFDPTEHEAIAQQPSDSVPTGNVSFVAQEGFRLHDRVVRPAQVIVSSGPASASH